MSFAFGAVVLVPFPFTDQTGAKKRPAVVVSSSTYNDTRTDIVIMALTGRVRVPFALGESPVAEWQVAGLVKPSMFKPVFATIERLLVVRKMGDLHAQDAATLRRILAAVIG